MEGRAKGAGAVPGQEDVVPRPTGESRATGPEARRAELDAGRNPADAPDLAAKREEEAAMVSEMIALWCRGHHGGVPREPDAPEVRVGLRRVRLCPECAELRAYALGRIGRCPHMGTKTFCSVCPTHCYRAQMRDRIREVMRWSGPRMLLVRPLPAIRHALVTVETKRAARAKGE